jgi:hypothetical protein
MSALPTIAYEPIQPPTLPRVNGTFTFNPSDDWAGFVASMADFRFRQSDRSNWLGPFVGYGDCLDPFTDPGDLTYYDPTLEPQDGDFLLVRWGPKALASEQFKRAADDWRKKYGVDPGPLASKRLRRVGSKWALCVRNSLFWLDDCLVLGVMVHKDRGGVALHAPVTCAIGPDAASDTAVFSAPADGSQAYTAGTQPRIEVSGLNASASYTAGTPGGGTVKAVVTWTGQAKISNTTSGVAVGEARLKFKAIINSVVVDDRWISLETFTGSEYGHFAGGAAYDVPDGQNITVQMFEVRTFTTSGASPAQTITWRAVSVSLSTLKR